MKDLKKEILAQGDGTYGALSFRYYYGGGHSVFYKVENGEVSIYDTQAGIKRSLDTINSSNMVKSTGYGYARLDNAEPNETVLGMVEANKKKGDSK